EALLRSDESYSVAPGYACVKEVHARDDHLDVLVVDLDRSMLDDLAGADPLTVSRIIGVHERRDPVLAMHGERSGIHHLVRYEDEPRVLLRTIEGSLGDGSVPSCPPVRARQQPSLLTDREIEVLRLIADGLTTRDVAARLAISPRTVE